MKNHTFYECDAASIWLPNEIKILQPLPGLFAKFPKRMIAIQLMPVDVLWESTKEQMDTPLTQSRSECQLEIVRQGNVKSPYEGSERIIQANYHSLDNHDYEWNLLLENNDRRAIITISGLGKFADNEDGWARVINSFRFK